MVTCENHFQMPTKKPFLQAIAGCNVKSGEAVGGIDGKADGGSVDKADGGSVGKADGGCVGKADGDIVTITTSTIGG